MDIESLYDTVEAPIDLTINGANTVVAAASGYRIVVHQLFIASAAAVTVTIKSGATNLTGGLALGSPGGLVLPFSKTGWFKTALGEALVFTTNAISGAGALTYSLQPR
jgi:hypothetical protein